MKCLIVDDCPLSVKITKHLVGRVPDLELVNAYSNPADASDFLAEHDVDLLFVDVEMPGMNGFEFLRSIKKVPVVIMMSAHEKYALQAFEINVADYLVKPLQEDRFRVSVQRARDLTEARNRKNRSRFSEVVFVKDSNVLRKLNFSEILWVEAQRDYARLQTREKFFMVHTTLKTLANKLPSEIFLRVHRSFIVSLTSIDHIEENTIYINKKAIPVSENYWIMLKDRLHLL